jgi:tetratricopeptide (TPR) repeat protein
MQQQSELGPLGPDYFFEGKYEEAEIRIKQQLERDERRLGPEHPAVASQLKSLAMAYHLQGKYSQAEPLLKRALAIFEKSRHAGLVDVLSMLAQLYLAQGNYSEVETLYLRVLSTSEKSPGPDSQQVALYLTSLAELYRMQGEYTRAEPLLNRSLAILEKKMRGDVAVTDYGNIRRGMTQKDRERVLKNLRTLVVRTLSELGDLFRVQGKYGEAEPIVKRSLAIYEKDWGPEHLQVTGSLERLAQLYHAQRKYKEAEALYMRAVAIEEKALGREHLGVATTLHNLAALYRDQGRYGQSESLFRRALAIREKVLEPGHPDVAESLNNLAKTLVLQRQHASALPLYERARRIHIRMVREVINLDDETQRGLLKAGYNALRDYTTLLAVVASERPNAGRVRAVLEAFVVADQLRGGLAQAALAKAGARAAASDAASADVARVVQDLNNQRRALRQRLTEEYGKAAAQRSARRVENLQKLVAQIDRDLANATDRLTRAVPKYTELAAPEPIDVAAVQKLLRSGEALVSYFTLDDRLLVWLVRKDKDLVYKDIAIKKVDLTKLVFRVRASLDQSGNNGLAGC